MNLDAWLRAAIADAERRHLPALKPLLEGLAAATDALRAANFTGEAAGTRPAGATQPADSHTPGSGRSPSR
jgi:hypothetical protein